MKNLLLFLKHYKGVWATTIVFAIVGTALFWNHAEMLIWNGNYSYIIYMIYGIFVLFLAAWIRNQWGLFKNSTWYRNK